MAEQQEDKAARLLQQLEKTSAERLPAPLGISSGRLRMDADCPPLPRKL